MDKNTITGLILIGLLLIVFSWLSKPTAEQQKLCNTIKILLLRSARRKRTKS